MKPTIVFDIIGIGIATLFLLANRQFARAYVDFQFRLTKRKYDVKKIRIFVILVFSIMIIFGIVKLVSENFL